MGLFYFNNVLSIYAQDYNGTAGAYTCSISQEDVLLQGAGGMWNPANRTVNYNVGSSGLNTVTTATLTGGGNYQERIHTGTITGTVSSGSLSYVYVNYKSERKTNEKQFELRNHLGSVVTVTSDRKLAYDDGTPDGTVDRYIPEINSWYDTYAFGSVAAGATLAGTNYRYGYQGSEKEPETNSGAYSTEFRILDSRIGRWFSPDMVEQPWQSPYCSMDNNPIALNDVLGLSTGGDEKQQDYTINTQGDKPRDFGYKSGQNNEKNPKGKDKFLEVAGQVLNVMLAIGGNVLEDMGPAQMEASQKLNGSNQKSSLGYGALTKDEFMKYLKETDACPECSENWQWEQFAGEKMEENVNDYLNRASYIGSGLSLLKKESVYGHRKPNKRFLTDDGRESDPDFVADFEYVDLNKLRGNTTAIYREIVHYEVKNSKRNLYLSSNNYQLEREILALARHARISGYNLYRKKHPGRAPQPSLYVFTTWEVKISNKVKKVANQNKIALRHYVAVYYMSGGVMNVTFVPYTIKAGLTQKGKR